MSLDYSVRKSTKVMQLNDVCMVGRQAPPAHPKNCRSECPYGHNRAHCFPCMKKIMEERRAAKKERETEEAAYGV